MKIEKRVKRAISVSVIILLVGMLLGAVIVIATTPSSTFYISSGVYPGAPSYTIWVEDSNYFAKDENGQLKYSGTNASEIIQNCDDALSGIGTLFFKAGFYDLSAPLTKDCQTNWVGEDFSNIYYSTTFRTAGTFPMDGVLVTIEGGYCPSGIMEKISFDDLEARNATGLKLDGQTTYLWSHTFRDLSFKYTFRDLHLIGDVISCTFDHIYCYSQNSAHEQDAVIILENGTGDYRPRLNTFINIKINLQGSYNHVIRLGGQYNTFIDIDIVGTVPNSNAPIDEAVITITDRNNEILNYFGQDLYANPAKSPRAKGNIYLSGAECYANKITGVVSYLWNDPHVTIDDGAFRNYVEVRPFYHNPVIVNATGAGVENTIAFIPPHLTPASTGLNLTHIGNDVIYQGYGITDSGQSEASNDDWVAFNYKLVATPKLVLLTVEETDANYIAQVKAKNATHFQLYLYDLTAASAETVDKTINWYAEYQP